MRVALFVPDTDAEELLTVVNDSLQAIREHKNTYAKREKELKQQITRLECEILDAQERRAKIIEDARDTYNVAIQTAAEAKAQARMEYLLGMSEG